MSSRALGLVPLVLLALAFALLVQQPGCGQTAHAVLTRSLAEGTPRIDRLHWQTCDKSWYRGHFYAAKAPGVALLSVPLWAGLDAAGLVWNEAPAGPAGPAIPASALWPLTLLASVAAAFALLVLLRTLADRVAPGTGTPTAVIAGAATLVLPYATLYGSQVLSALLGLAAFAAFHLRRAPLAAGLLAGLAVTVDYPLALLAVILGAYVLAVGAPRVEAAARYAAGIAAGALPLLAFDLWAFGSPFHQAYENAVVNQGETGHDQLGANSAGFYGVSVPKPHALLDLLFADRGLVTATPVVALGVAMCLTPLGGERRFRRLALAVFTAFLLYDAGYYLPFGGDTPGPRFLIPALPFVLVPLAGAVRRLPVTTAALAGVSVLTMVAATATRPMIGLEVSTRTWFSDVAHGEFTRTVFTAHAAGSGPLAIAPFLALVAAACALVVRRPQLRRDDLAVAAVSLASWAALASVLPPLLD